MKNTIIKKFLAIRESSSIRLKNLKAVILARSEKLDPNNKEIQQKPLLKNGTKKELHDDGFEHRSSKETTDPI